VNTQGPEPLKTDLRQIYREGVFHPSSDEFEAQGKFRWRACGLRLEKHLCSSQGDFSA